jgi:hypothetical protein
MGAVRVISVLRSRGNLAGQAGRMARVGVLRSSLARRELDGDDRLCLVQRDARAIAIREDDASGL